jgi:hypothetical protein
VKIGIIDKSATPLPLQKIKFDQGQQKLFELLAGTIVVYMA